MGTPKRLGSLRQTATIIKWPTSFGVVLEIDPDCVDDDATVGLVGLRLVEMGGSLVGWKPDLDRRPAVAQFDFSRPADRDRFLAKALEIAGVSRAQHR